MKNKFMLLLLSILMVLCYVEVPVSAEEIGQLEGETHRYRWGYTYINSGGDVKKCRLQMNDDNLTGIWASTYTNLVNHWNTLDTQFSYSQDKVYAYDCNSSTAKCFLYTASSNSFMYTNSSYQYIDAIALLCNSSNA